PVLKKLPTIRFVSYRFSLWSVGNVQDVRDFLFRQKRHHVWLRQPAIEDCPRTCVPSAPDYRHVCGVTQCLADDIWTLAIERHQQRPVGTTPAKGIERHLKLGKLSVVQRLFGCQNSINNEIEVHNRPSTKNAPPGN